MTANNEYAQQLRSSFALLVSRTLPNVTDNFTIEIKSAGQELPYVQGCIEDDGLLEIEISGPQFLTIPVLPGGPNTLEASGWHRPEDDQMPNFWQVVNTRLNTWDEITRMFVDGLERLYDIFNRAPAEVAIEVMPLQLAAKVWPEDLPIDAIRMPGEEEAMLVNIPDYVPKESSVGKGEPELLTFDQWVFIAEQQLPAFHNMIDAGDDSVMDMAVSQLLLDPNRVGLSDLPACLTHVAELIDNWPNWQLVQHDLHVKSARVSEWLDLTGHWLEGASYSPWRLAAILESPYSSRFEAFRVSQDMLDRAMIAIADHEDIDARKLALDPDPLVRAAFVIGHGDSCPMFSRNDQEQPVDRARERIRLFASDAPPLLNRSCSCQEFESEMPSKSSGMPHLHFHQRMWLAEGGSPMYAAVIDNETYGRDRVWGDQADFEDLLPYFWTARRSDDWQEVASRVRAFTLTPSLVDRSSIPGAHAAYNALNHMLLYAGNGSHPLHALDELTMNDPEHEMFGGFSANFLACFGPMLQDLQAWWRRSVHAGHNAAGLEERTLPREFEFAEADNSMRDTASLGDGLHLMYHYGAPAGIGQWADHSTTGQHALQWIEPTVVTVSVPSYWDWMAVLRNLEIEQPTLAKVMIEPDPTFLDGIVLGFWLLQRLPQPVNGWRNNARFITDAQAPAIMTLVRDWQ